MAAAGTEARLGYIPHFDVVSLSGQRVRYHEIWQRRNLVLLLLNPHDRGAASPYVTQLEARQREFDQAESTTVVTTDGVPGLAPPRVIIADRWGEILYMKSLSGGDLSKLPSVDELLSWVQFVRMQCPECPP